MCIVRIRQALAGRARIGHGTATAAKGVDLDTYIDVLYILYCTLLY